MNQTFRAMSVTLDGSQTSNSLVFNSHAEITQQATLEAQFHKHFYPVGQVHRRNPDQYMRNPNKIYYTTMGAKSFTMNDSPKKEGNNTFSKHATIDIKSSK